MNAWADNMLIEHRAYTLKAGCMESFWQAQRDRGYELVKPILDRLIGYFSTMSEPKNQVIHLYRYDSYDDWLKRLQGLYGIAALEPYFKTARTLIVAQENRFLVPAPVVELTPLLGNGNDWLPGDRQYANLASEPALLVEESVTTLLPGALPAYWQAYRDYGLLAGDAATDHLLGCFVSFVGKQHQVIHYRCYPDFSARQRQREAWVDESKWRIFGDVTAALIVSTENKLLKPVQIAQLSPLFYGSKQG